MLQKIKTSAKFIIPVLLLGFIILSIYQNRISVINSWSNFKVAPLSISLIFMILIYLEAAFNYHVLIKILGYPLRFNQSLYIFIVSNAGRYVPGTIWQYIGRVEMAKKIGGLSRNISVLSLLLEIFLLVNSALIVSLIALPFFRGNINQSYLFIFIIPLSLIFLHPKVAKFILQLGAKITKRDLGNSLLKFNFTKLISVLPYFILNFFLNGIALFFLSKSIFPEITWENILLFSGLFAFSWVVGYLSFLAPAGLGVSDFLLTYLLSSQIPFALASTIALSYRLLLTVAEMVVFLFVLRINTKKKDLVISDTKNAWEKRSLKFGYKIEGVATKSLPSSINAQLDIWMLENIEGALNSQQKNNLKVLDLGCGYGRLSKPILKKYSQVKTFGIDISKNYVDLYNKDLKPRGKAMEGDIQNLPFNKESFDIVFIVTTLMYLTNISARKRAVREMIRVLKPGGKLIIIERSPSGYYLFTMGGLINLIRGKINKEIQAVSIERKSLLEIINKTGGKLESISSIPFLSLLMPSSVIVNKMNSGLLSSLISSVNYLDKKFKWILWPSLYLSYTISKPASRK